jgi:nitroimidazol reductase NimA-like FMN-containing flavoprotein (pyridoxamine 5'-phosphate oxidase superfamily)
MRARRTRSKVSYESILRLLRRRTVGFLATAGADGRPHAVAVEYAVAIDGTSLYVMTRMHLKKARNIAVNPNVPFVVPLTRGVLRFLPPPSIHLQGVAAILDRHDEEGIAAFKSFFMGRQILRMYERFERRGERRVCFIRITPAPVVVTYAVGHSILELRRKMEVGLDKVEVPAGYRR